MALLCARKMHESVAVSGPKRFDASMKIPRLRTQAAEQRGQVFHARGDDVLDAVDAFEAAVDRHQARFDQDPALALGEVAPDHGVDHAVFVFQAQEGHAAGGFGLLAHGHQAGEAHPAAVRGLVQLRGAPALPRMQGAAQQRQRMPAEGGAEQGVVGLHVFAGGR